MCNYQTLYHGTAGYVIRCPHCKGVQLAFGTTVVNLTGAEFVCFAEMVSRLAEEKTFEQAGNEKMICLPLPADHVMMLLTPAEVSRLADITAEVHGLLSVYEILDAPSQYMEED
ncbi:DUF6686 family protein [Chitinophaga nivalis]|uniref:Uncharacterized protein n=1 Tax=Chitinophaga nivalis TaxID=2991709 RepID=A0ABT3IT87_9BACT|nr:DUF6686 family protein [Chitinophaga nivalis]MCW3463118.1 hypothetical protein [Chitinophaga nivalis]MCW3487192.1 hypothetical protein [Chitinophaga nivalis]